MQWRYTGPSSTSKNNFSSALFTLVDASLNCPTYKTEILLNWEWICYKFYPRLIVISMSESNNNSHNNQNKYEKQDYELDLADKTLLGIFYFLFSDM